MLKMEVCEKEFMSDLIRRSDALDLCKAIENELQADIIDAEKNPNAYSSDFIKGMSSRMDGVLDVAIEIYSLPSADAIEVVRCKDCHLAQDDITHLFCDYFGHKVYEDDFCSHGERKGGDNE